jgi:hypothetical protein
MRLRITEGGVQKEIPESEVEQMLSSGTSIFTYGGEPAFITKVTKRAKGRTGLLVKVPSADPTHHLNVIAFRDASFRLYISDDDEVEQTAARHVWEKDVRNKTVRQAIAEVATLEPDFSALSTRFVPKSITVATGFVLVGTPFEPTLELAGPPIRHPKIPETTFNLLAPAPKFLHASEFVRLSHGSFGLHVVNDRGMLACDAFVYALPGIKGWYSVGLPLIAEMLELGAEAAADVLMLALSEAEVDAAISEMLPECMALMRAFPEVVRSWGVTVPAALQS